MKNEENKLQDSCYLEVVLGSMQLSLSDFLSLRAGSEVSMECQPELEVKLCFSGRAWGKGVISIGESQADLKITQIGEQTTFS